MQPHAIKEDIAEHFDVFRTNASQIHGYNTRNGHLPKLKKPRTERGNYTTFFKALNGWASLPNELKRPMLHLIFKRNLRELP